MRLASHPSRYINWRDHFHCAGRKWLHFWVAQYSALHTAFMYIFFRFTEIWWKLVVWCIRMKAAFRSSEDFDPHLSRSAWFKRNSILSFRLVYCSLNYKQCVRVISCVTVWIVILQIAPQSACQFGFYTLFKMIWDEFSQALRSTATAEETPKSAGIIDVHPYLSNCCSSHFNHLQVYWRRFPHYRLF